MTELRIPEGLEEFQKPSTLPRYVVILFLRLHSIPKVLLEEDPPGLPRTFVDNAAIRADAVKDMIERMKERGECTDAPDCFEWEKGAAEGTDYFLVDGSKIQAAKGYKWYSLLEYGVPGLPSGREGVVIFSRMYRKATGHGWPDTLL